MGPIEPDFFGQRRNGESKEKAISVKTYTRIIAYTSSIFFINRKT